RGLPGDEVRVLVSGDPRAVPGERDRDRVSGRLRLAILDLPQLARRHAGTKGVLYVPRDLHRRLVAAELALARLADHDHTADVGLEAADSAPAVDHEHVAALEAIVGDEERPEPLRMRHRDAAVIEVGELRAERGCVADLVRKDLGFARALADVREC